MASLSERTDAAQQTWFRLSALAERVSATVRIASERAQYLDTEPTAGTGPDPDDPGGPGRRDRRAEQQLLADLEQARARLEVARADLGEKETAATEAERAHLAAVRAEADRREGLARLTGQVETVRARVESIDDGVARLTAAIDEAAARTEAPRPNSTPCRAGSANSTRASWVSTSTTTARWPHYAWPTNGWPNCRPPSVPPNARSRLCAPASTRSPWGWTAKTAPPGWWRTAAAQGFSAPWPN